MAGKTRKWRYEHDSVKYFSVTEVLKFAGMSFDYTVIPQKTLANASERGTEVHRCMEHLCSGLEIEHDTLKSSWIPYVEAGEEWFQGHFVEKVELEKFVHCPVSRVAGRADFLGVLADSKPGLAVADFKTREPDPVDPLQLAAYKHLLAVTYAREGDPGMAARVMHAKRYGVYLLKSGKYKVKEYDDENDLSLFYSALENTWWRFRNGRL